MMLLTLQLNQLKHYQNAVGIPSGLTELGVKEEDFEVMATNAKADACQFTNPRLATFTTSN